MAKLLSEDEAVVSSLELVLLKDQIRDKTSISWVPYKIMVSSAKQKLVFEKIKNDNGTGDYVFAIKPVNEIENLIEGVRTFLSNQNNNMFSFEAIEPSFELIFERAHKGYSATCWFDSGNVISDHYTWDGFGLRFFTSKEKIISFVEELDKEKEFLFSHA